jgi:hypothetical protein
MEQTNKPMPAKASISQLGKAKDITSRGEGIEDMRTNGVWKHANSNFVYGNLSGKYDSEDVHGPSDLKV